MSVILGRAMRQLGVVSLVFSVVAGAAKCALAAPIAMMGRSVYGFL